MSCQKFNMALTFNSQNMSFFYSKFNLYLIFRIILAFFVIWYTYRINETEDFFYNIKGQSVV